MNQDLDVWAVQSHPEELDVALDFIEKEGAHDSLLYKNALCQFRIGTEEIRTKQFDTFLYTKSREEKDILIMLMRGGKASFVDIEEGMEKRCIPYHVAFLAPSISSYEADPSIPEIWFAGDKSVLADALQDTIEKSIEYYPFLTGEMDVSYLLNSTSQKENIDGISFRGAIKCIDKIILFIKQKTGKNVTARDVEEVAKQYGIAYTVLEAPSLGLTQKVEKVKKKDNRK